MSGAVPARARWTPVPDLFFSRLLPELDDGVALKLVLHLTWRIHRRPTGRPPALARAELLADPTLRRGLAALGVAEADLERRLEAALDRLVAAGWILAAGGGAGASDWLLLNTAEGRAARTRLSAADATRPELAGVRLAPSPLPPERPNIFVLYEDNIGLVTPLLAEELAAAAEDYPAEWIERAFRRAVANNSRNWRYIRAILERWARDGVDDAGHRRGAEEDRDGPREDPYAPWVQR